MSDVHTVTLCMGETMKIYLDIDGVLVSFVLAAFQYHCAPIQNEGRYPKGHDWDILGAVNHVRDQIGAPGFRADEFWDFPEWFWDMEPYPGMHEFVKQLEKRGDVTLATACTMSPACAAGKLRWIQDNLPQFARNYVITPRKELLADCYSVLIDDYPRNCKRFAEAGGRSILVPRPWNGQYGADAYPYVLEQL